MNDRIAPVTLDVPESALADLRDRLDRVRWPAGRTVDDTSQGPSPEKLQALVERWRTGYDWRACEKLLNDLGGYRTEIDSLDIDFMHVRSPEPDALPLLITHGWPGSVLEFRKVVSPLTDPVAHGGKPSDAFHLVLPTLPGFGFSAKPAETGWNIPRIARAWITLMDRLGYERWVIQGGDFGAAVAEEVAHLAPPGLGGIHLNFATFQPTREEIAEATPAERAMVDSAGYYMQNLSAYMTLQATRPQTIGYSLADSPVGLAAWIYAMFQDVAGTPGDAEATFTHDEMLDDIMLYWLPNSGASSARLYWEWAHTAPTGDRGAITLPIGFAMAPEDHVRKSRRWIERRYPTLVHYDELDRGGHFAALEDPEGFVSSVRATFAGLR